MLLGLALLILGTEPAEARKIPGHVPTAEVSDHELHALSAAFDAYEDARAALAQDAWSSVADPARRLSARLDEAREGLDPHHPLRKRIGEAMAATDKLTMARQPETYREQFAALSEALVGIARTEPRLREGRSLYVCPMTKGYAYWIQTGDEIGNPYAGKAMPGCGRQVGWDEPEKMRPS